MAIKKLEIHKEKPHVKEKLLFANPLRDVMGFFLYDYEMGMHEQDFYEINIVTKGSGEHFIGDFHYTVSIGDVFIVPPNVWHGYLGGKGFDVYHAVFAQRYMEKNAYDLHLLPAFSTLFKIDPLMRENYSAKLQFNLTNEELNELLPSLRNLETYSSKCEISNYRHISNSLTMIIISYLCSIYESRFLSAKENEREDKDFLSSLSYIYENYNKSISINELIKVAHMSRTAYLNKFKQITSTTPQKFQTEYKITMAKSLLTQTKSSITEIAEEVGFYDLPHFTRVFTKEMGVSPNEYRQKQKSQT